MALSTSVPAGGGLLSGFVLSLMGITEGGYRYTEDLLALESQQADGLPQLSLLRAPTPVVVTSLLPALCLHPDQRFAEYNGTDCWQAFALDLAGAALCMPFITITRRRASTQRWCRSTSGLSCSEGHWWGRFIRPLQHRCTPALLSCCRLRNSGNLDIIHKITRNL